MPAPRQPAVPDLDTSVLPGLAYLRSLRDQTLPMRTTALEDACEYFYGFGPDTDLFERQLAVLGVIGEALQVVEDVGALANSFFASPPGIGFYATAANSSPRAIDRFYQTVGSRSDEEILALLGFRVGTQRLHELFRFDPPLSKDELDALGEVEAATAMLVKRHLVHLATGWVAYRHHFHAYKHALLVANPEDAVMVEGDDETAIEAIVVWRRKTSRIEAQGFIRPPYDEAVETADGYGQLAIDLAEHLVETRLRLFEPIVFEPDGSVRVEPMSSPPWVWWLKQSDVSQAAREVLRRRLIDLGSDS